LPHKRNPSLRNDDGACAHADLPHIATLIADGEITVGILNPVGCVAVATDGHNTLPC
jgi:glycine/serine hydroxymethyltransferase